MKKMLFFLAVLSIGLSSKIFATNDVLLQQLPVGTIVRLGVYDTAGTKYYFYSNGTTLAAKTALDSSDGFKFKVKKILPTKKTVVFSGLSETWNLCSRNDLFGFQVFPDSKIVDNFDIIGNNLLDVCMKSSNSGGFIVRDGDKIRTGRIWQIQPTGPIWKPSPSGEKMFIEVVPQ